MMNKKYKIEQMTESEIRIALEWAKHEGWNPGLYDATCFYRVDPKGFFTGKLQRKIIAVVSAVNYDDQYSFCGFFIVNPKYRKQGYGLELARQIGTHIGQRNAGIDGVINMVDKYAQMGFVYAHNNARYECHDLQVASDISPEIVTLDRVPFELLKRYDRQHFPAARDAFLKCWISQPKSKSVGYFKQNELLGYGVIRACHQGYKIGPLFANTPQIADALILSLSQHAQGESLFLDVPENNPHALELVQRYPFQKVFETARMYLKGQPDIATDQIYGITSFELG